MRRIRTAPHLFKFVHLLALAWLAALPAPAAIVKQVTPEKNLQQVAREIWESVDSATFRVQFSTYASVGKFRLEAPPSRIDTLIFERDSSQESDSVLRVSGDTALFEIKSMNRGTVVLKGLAFHLTSPRARLLAGSETGKENLNLVIDSCFFFGDSIAFPFLNWLGSSGSKVEIRRSFFVFPKGSATDTRVNLAGEHIVLANNLFNFPGQVLAEVTRSGIIDIRFNTINRTQFRLDSDGFRTAVYEFRQNFIGFKGSQDAFNYNGMDYYVVWATNFDSLGSLVLNTRMYPGWAGFEHPGGLQKFPTSSSNVVLDPGLITKSQDELWNWYMSGPDTAIGHQGGQDRRKDIYNVWPGQVSAGIRFELNPGRAYFKPAPFPRQFKDGRLPLTVPGDQPLDIRVHSPEKGALHFGPFQLDSLSISMATTLGRPVLLSSSASRFTPQRVSGAYKTSPFPFVNDSPAARKYFIAFQGNTPRGTNVEPGPGSSVGPGDTLSFAKVDAAGFTELRGYSLPAGTFPDTYRFLQVGLKIITSASISDSVTFGSKDALVAPWIPSKVFWWNPQSNTLLPAVLHPGGKYCSKALFKDSIAALLVEVTNVKRGGTTQFTLSDTAEARAVSAGGYQLAIDKSFQPDPIRYGKATPGYAFSYIGRGDGDDLSLILPGGKDVRPWRINLDQTITPADSTPGPDGKYTIHVAMVDSNVRFFTGIRYNVIANEEFQANLGGVSISGLHSRKSGMVSIQPFDDALLDQGTGKGDTLPADSRILGAKGIQTQFLDLAYGFSATFNVGRPVALDSVAVYAWNGQGWRPLPTPQLVSDPVGHPDSVMAAISGLQQGDLAFVVLERLMPASSYVTVAPKVEGRKIVVTSKYQSDLYRPITGFRLIVLKANHLGVVDTVRSSSVPAGIMDIGDTAIADLKDESGLFMYGIQYYSAIGPYGRANLVHLPGFNWLPEKIAIPLPAKAERKWHLLGYPYRASFSGSLVRKALPSVNVQDITAALQAGIKEGKPGWVPLATEKLTLAPGDAFLFNSARPHERILDPKGEFVGAAACTVNAAGQPGWKLISAPYPMTFHASKVVSTAGATSRFMKFVVEDPPDSSKFAAVYHWQPETVLRAFEGYAYQFADGEKLIFDPWSALPGGALPKAAHDSEPQTLKVVLKTDFKPRSMELQSGRNIRSISFLPAPGDGPELRVGGEGGYLVKKLEDLRSIDEAVRIRVPYAQRGSLALERIGALASIPDWQAMLLDPGTGRVLDLKAGGEMSWPAGTSEYRLVAGDGAYVRERVGTFQAGIPGSMALSQNYPNPFRKFTSIAMDWPALPLASAPSGSIRKAWLDVFNARGHRVQRLDLGPVKAGRQVATLDAGRWEAGLYTYRLTLETGGRRIHMQKKMLVAP